MATVTFTFENRKIQAGEFMGAFGHGQMIVDELKNKNTLFIGKTMTAEWTETSATLTGKLPNRTKEDIWKLSHYGIITDLSY